MAEGTPSQVKIPADSDSASAHSIRTLTVPNPNLVAQSEDGAGTVVPTLEKQQVISVADGNGDVADVEDGALSATDKITHQLLVALIVRMDILNGALVRRYASPDDLGLGG